MREDPVTGSLNAGIAQWLISTGAAPGSYRAGQGARVGRRGVLTVRADGDVVWVGDGARPMFAAWWTCERPRGSCVDTSVTVMRCCCRYARRLCSIRPTYSAPGREGCRALPGEHRRYLGGVPCTGVRPQPSVPARMLHPRLCPRRCGVRCWPAKR
ncbi:hypothetical protein [Salinispora arenicola]|uniref:hypothetical protein n=1 Tax=Salinispora arenicola TaxID=168697 RepID=UPI0027DB07B6|nr:hypothetical protein [Salinispora arenicola]